MVGPDGLEPSTPRLSSACSNQLSYEPELGNWQVLRGLGPSSFDRNYDEAAFAFQLACLDEAPKERRLVEPDGFEPTTPCLQSRCSAN